MGTRRLAAILWVFVILLLCWTPRIWIEAPQGPRFFLLEIPHLDKIVHLGIFTVFALLWMHALPGGHKSILFVVAFGLGLAVVTEIVQNVPIINRQGDFVDGTVDLLGALLGIAAYKIQARYLGNFLSPGLAVPRERELA